MSGRLVFCSIFLYFIGYFSGLFFIGMCGIVRRYNFILKGGAFAL